MFRNTCGCSTPTRSNEASALDKRAAGTGRDSKDVHYADLFQLEEVDVDQVGNTAAIVILHERRSSWSRNAALDDVVTRSLNRLWTLAFCEQMLRHGDCGSACFVRHCQTPCTSTGTCHTNASTGSLDFVKEEVCRD
jgi:hypothetical protein